LDGNSKKYRLSTAPIIKVGSKLVPNKLKPKIISLLLRYRHILWAGSTIISFVPTYVCNYQCPYCFIHTKFNYAKVFPRNSEHSWEEWVQAFDKLPQSFIHITGGEPLSYPELIPLLENMPKKHTILAVATNLTLHVDELSKLPNRRFFISTSFHSHMTDKESFGERVLKMKRAGFPVSVSVVAYPDRIALLPEFKRYFEDEIGVRFVVNPYLDPFYKYSKEEADIVEKYVPSRIKVGWAEDTRPKTCVAGSKYFQFLPNGDVYTCLSGIYYATSDLHEGICENPGRFYLGNLFDGSFKPLDGPMTCSCPCSERCDQGYGRVKLI